MPSNRKSSSKKKGKIDRPRLQTIQDFDESDAAHSSWPRAVVSSAQPGSNSYLMVQALIRYICMMYSRGDENHAQNNFKQICPVFMKYLNIRDPVMKISNTNPFFGLLSDLFNNVDSKLQPKLLRCEEKIYISSRCENTRVQEKYDHDFEEHYEIDKGSFGSVCKARCKMDDKWYAIKKVIIKHKNIDNLPMVHREVLSLATFDHENIVRYYSSWLEYATCDSTSSGSSHDSSQSQYNSQSTSVCFVNNDYNSSSSIIFQNVPFDEENLSTFTCSSTSVQNDTRLDSVYRVEDRILRRDFQAVKVCSEIERKSSVNNVNVASNSRCIPKVKRTSPKAINGGASSASNCRPFYSNGSDGTKILKGRICDKTLSRAIKKITLKNDVCSGNGNLELPSAASARNLQTAFPELGGAIPLPTRDFCLYIQMELCSEETLRHWLDNRNRDCEDVDECRNMRIIEQILKAVEYIHLCDIIHRDLKPGNVFFEKDGDKIKIGDFGLSREILTLNEMQSDNDQHSMNIGTSFYIAPEVKESTTYNHKCDIYSVGIVLFELFVPFKTEMERSRELKDLQKKPKYILKKYCDKWCTQMKMLPKMTASDPNKRLEAFEILDSELFVSKDKIINKQGDKIKKLEKKNKTSFYQTRMLREKIEKLEKEIFFQNRHIRYLTLSLQLQRSLF